MKKTKELINRILSTIIDCIVPTLPVMIGVGMLKVLLIILSDQVLNILPADSSTCIVLSFVADAGYYFMPVYIAVSSADVFKTNRYLAALCGAMLLSPAYTAYVASGASLSVYGLPIAMTGYDNQVLSPILIVFFLSLIYHFIDDHLHANLKPILTPLLTIMIMIPIAFCAIGPIGVYLGNKLVELILFLKDLGPIGNAIMCAIIPFITIIGLGGANLSAMLLLAAGGCDPILFYANVLYNTILGFVTLAIYLQDKEPEKLAAAITATVGGTSEPAIFSIVMKDARAMASLVIGDFFAGFYAGLMGVKSYAMASFGVFGIITTIGPDSSLLHAAIAMVIGCSIGFILSYLSHRRLHE